MACVISWSRVESNKNSRSIASFLALGFFFDMARIELDFISPKFLTADFCTFFKYGGQS